MPARADRLPIPGAAVISIRMSSFADRLRSLLSTPGRRWAAGGGVVALVVLIAVGALALGGGGDEPTSSTPVAATGTTLAPDQPASTTLDTVPDPGPTITATTITSEGFSLSLEDAPEGFDEAVAALYQWTAGLVDEPPADLPDGLVAHLGGATPTDSLELEGTVTSSRLRDRGLVAVATLDDDVVLGVDDGDGWQVVGAKLASFDKAAWYGESPRFVLVIGSDANWQEDVFKKNGDSIQLFAAGPPESAGGAILGIPRDSWVPLPDGSNNKFTNVLPGGGPEGMLEVARNLTGLPIEGYIITGFLGFEQVARGFGLFPIDLVRPVRGGTDPGGTPGFPDFAAGTQELSPEDLLLFLRIRKTLPNGDFDRVDNAGMVTLAALTSAQGRGIGELPSLLSVLAASTHHDLSTSQLLTLGATAFELDPTKVVRKVLPGTTGTVGAADVVFLDAEATVVFADVSDGLLDGG